MQIRLTDQNIELVSEFKKLCKAVIPSYETKDTALVNGMLTDKLRQEIERLKKKKS